MATLINGNGNPRIYAAQDADLIAALAGDITGIAQIGNKFAATAVDANTISVADGVIVTKEGRRIQLDAGSTDMFVIPTGTTGVTNYYIIGYKLTTQSDDSQIAETFVQLMSSSSETITEDTFREGATDVYVSLYRVEQDGVNLGTITGLLPELTNISELQSDINRGYVETITDGVKTFSQVLDTLFSLIDFSKVRPESKLITIASIPQGTYTGIYINAGWTPNAFMRLTNHAISISIDIDMMNTGSTLVITSIGDGATSYEDRSSLVAGAGSIYRFVY